MSLSTLQTTPRGVARKTRGQDGFATSFPVGLLHPLQHAGLSRRSPVSRQTRNKATEGRSQDLSGILSLETHATPIESPNRATQWRGIRRAAFNRCLAEAPGFLYQLYFPISWKEVHQLSVHDSTITSPFVLARC